METQTKPLSLSDLTGPYAYALHTVNAWGLTGDTTVYADSAQAAVDHARAMGYRRAEAAPAVPVNGYREGLPVKHGDTASYGYPHSN